MLPVQALQSAHPIAAGLDARDLIVRPQAGSLLAKLCELSSSDDSFVRGDQGQREFMLDLVAESTNGPDVTVGTCLHDVEMNEIAQAAGEAVSKHLAYARTVVAPAIDDLVQRVAASIEQVMRSDMNQLEVVVYRLPAPMYEPSFVESFQRANDIAVDNFVPGLAFPDADSATIIGWTKSGVSGLDEAVDQYITALGLPNFQQIYKDLFTTQRSETQLWDLFNRADLGLDYAVIGFLIARKLWDAPPEGVEMSLQSYEKQMVDLRDQCAKRLIYELQRVERDETNGVLVRSYGRSSVEVNDRVYRTWLENGGDHAILFGNVLSDRPKIDVKSIMEGADGYKAAWDRFCLLNKTTEANKRFNNAKLIMRVEFDAQVAAASQEDLPLQERPLVLQKFEEALACTKESEVADLYSWVLRLLCDSRFYKTDAFRILEGINRIKAHSPDVDVKEAAAVAALEYIAYWVSSQFCVENATR